MKSFIIFGTLLGGRLPKYRKFSLFFIGVFSLFFLPAVGIGQVNMNITDPGPICEPATIDLTLPFITAGSSEGLVFSYWTDSAATLALARPFSVGGGTYYIKGEDAEGSFVVKAVTVTVRQFPTVIIHDPEPVLAPATVDLTANAVTEGSDPGLELTYWNNGVCTEQLANPMEVALSGTYYIMATKGDGCFVINPVLVTINSSTGIEGQTGQNIFRVYPNPNNGTFTLRYNSSNKGLVDLSILDITGKVVYSRNHTLEDEPLSEKIELTKKLPGIYFIRIVRNEGVIYKKIKVE